MYFESFDAFIAMGGHGPYIWAAYGITLVVMAGLVWAPLSRRQRFLTEQRQRARREQRQSANVSQRHPS